MPNTLESIVIIHILQKLNYISMRGEGKSININSKRLISCDNTLMTHTALMPNIRKIRPDNKKKKNNPNKNSMTRRLIPSLVPGGKGSRQYFLIILYPLIRSY
jgi:hypothetical protein